MRFFQEIQHPSDIDALGKQYQCEALDVRILADARRLLWQGNRAYVLSDGGMRVSLAIMNFGKRKHNAWGPYVNWYTSWTPEPLRRRGYATELARTLFIMARVAGCVRVKSLIQSYAGVRLHWRLGHSMWGWTDKGFIQVDHPLVSRDWPSTTPEQARAVTSRQEPWSVAELEQELVARGFASGPSELTFLREPKAR